ncbi:MAG: PIN domain-containing protein [Planctomycetes bacterium]|nr:PIN domain-containing protein [Planctomycetota bacterium]
MMAKRARPRIVAIDSNTMVFGFRKQGTKQQLEKAANLLAELDEEGVQIIIPSVALSEYLIPISAKKHNEVIAQLSKRYIIAPFDAKCATVAARLFAIGRQQRGAGKENVRKTLRADSLIIATASVHGAMEFYSDDDDCRRLASHVPRLTAKELPAIAHSLFAIKA